MLNLKKTALGFTCLVCMLMASCASTTPTPATTNPPQPSDTALPTFAATWTLTPTRPTQTRLPTQTQIIPGVTGTTTVIPLETYTATTSNLPTDTLTPTLNPNLPTATSTETPVQNTKVPTQTRTATMTATLFDAGELVSQTLQDKSNVTAGQPFKVTFTLKNTGTSTWTSGYGLKWFSGLPGYSMYPANNVPVPQDVLPGETVDLTITCQAPTAAGSYFSMWFLQNSTNGFNFVKAYIEIEVK